ncbi:hypothetical protein Rsub_02681 [Raphidocelis subcapitata]|uniref:Uncharacterized protein n=1 Tax=Raphidocelis subcapitata TaxID=307507 RepID=A0A2V0NYT0_9CHLO|nr:hypothetical protein Rsub_02681 [Raphidocelis subcapitata]|eukprot:GBF89975.1 hypothetical protein Rsub_02681 [Raphidocelis subcapitata]
MPQPAQPHGATGSCPAATEAAAGPPTPAALLAALPPSVATHPGRGAALPALGQLLRLLNEAHAIAEARRGVDNMHKLAKRIRQNAGGVEQHIARLNNGAPAAPAAAAAAAPAAEEAAAAGAAAPADEPGDGPSAAVLQGVLNNIRGFVAELQAVDEAPGVVAVLKKFRAPADGGGGSSGAAADGGGGGGAAAGAGGATGSGGPAAGGSPAAGGDVVVEVDVVAHGGQTWIEVKGSQAFGVGSKRWLGAEGLKQQVAAMVAVARSPGCAVRYRPPQVVVFCPLGADPEVAAELEAMGARVASGIGSLADLPEPHPPPATTNLDTTSLCALVSEVSHRPTGDPEIAAWAARTSHWAGCVAAERERRVLSELGPFVSSGRRLIAASTAVDQFERLLVFGGPSERRRWREEVLPRIEVYEAAGDDGGAAEAAADGSGARAATSSSGDGGSGADGRPSAAAAPPPARRVFRMPPAIAQLQQQQQLRCDVFGLGLALEALTLTANSNAVRHLGDQRVALEARVHRPVWLTGL